MGFTYVLVPADANEPMQELEYPENIEDLAKDTFRSHVEEYYRALGGSCDRSVLMAQLQERTGTNLQEKIDKNEMSGETLDRLLSSTSVEIFPVMMPTRDNNFEAVSVYCDDKGVAKGLEDNPRMAGLVQSAGFPSQSFKGDCFIGRVFDDTEDEWRRCNFSLADCSSDAPWVAACKKQRSNRSSSDMSSLANKIGVKNAANINPGMLEDAAPKGETEQYQWRQVDDEVEITFKKDGLKAGDKKLVKVNFGAKRLKVEAKGEVLIDAATFGPTRPDESTWTLSDGVLQVMLAKAGEDSWDDLVKA